MESPTFALFDAIEKGRVEDVIKAMANGGNPDPDDGRNALLMRISKANFEMKLRRFHYITSKKSDDQLTKEDDDFLEEILRDLSNHSELITELEEDSTVTEETPLHERLMDPICKYFIDNHPKLVKKDVLATLAFTYEFTLPLLYYTIQRFDENNVWHQSFRTTKKKVLSDVFCDVYINKCINEKTAKLLPLMIESGISVHQKFKIQIMEPTDWSLYDQFSQKVVKTIALNSGRIFPSMAEILEQLLDHGLNISVPFEQFEIFDEIWPAPHVKKTLLNYLLLLRIRLRNRSQEIYNGKAEFYHMKKRGTFELENMENVIDKIDELLATFFRLRPYHFTYMNNEMLIESIASLNLLAKEQPVNKRNHQELIVELVRRHVSQRE